MRPARLLLLVFIFCFPPAFSQENYQILYSAQGDAVIEWIIPSNDGNLIFAGNTKSHDPSGDGIIMKTDNEGNIIWSKIYGGDGRDEFTKIIPCAGGYAVIGYTNSYGQGDMDAWVTGINEDGEWQWSYSFGTYWTDAARGITETKDGGFMVVGQEDAFDYGFMLKLNSNGNLLWKKEFYLGIVLWFNDVFETSGGEFYFTGAVNWDGFGIHDTFILETDSTGNIIRCKVYGGQDNDSFRTMVPYGEGFLTTGDTWSWENHQLGWLARINKDLDVEKSVVLGASDANQYLESACIISNDIFAVIKQLTDGSSYVIELDSLLALKASWQFNQGYSSYSSHIAPLADSSIVFAGSSTDEQTFEKDIYMIRFHPGEAISSCNTVSHSTFIKEVSVQSDDLTIYEGNTDSYYQKLIIESSNIDLQSDRLCLPVSVDDNAPGDESSVTDLAYPIPAKDKLYINLARTHLKNYIGLSAEILDLKGELLIKERIDGTDGSANPACVLDISSLAAGMYFLLVKVERKVISREKFIVIPR